MLVYLQERRKITDVNDNITPNFYSIIPADLRYDNRLKATEKIFFSEISALTNVYGYCYAGNKYFSKLYDCDVRTITRWLSNLEKLGYIKVELIRDERQMILERRIYTRESLQGGIDKNVHRDVDNFDRRGMGKNVLNNNIYYNNITHTQEQKESKVKYADKVYMYDYEYNDLKSELGEIKADKCITELDLYKKSKGVEYASDYDTIKRWVIDRVNELESKENKNKTQNITKKNNYNNYEGREYSEELLDSLYENL